ncbi:MAG: GNAT family N-acetyltransferase [Actinomycetota bacterium]|nr:GNAT family N-acetyltransferase [Actinomycetota bacterium]
MQPPPTTVLRTGDPSDQPAVLRMHDRCSAQSLSRRYHAPLPRLSPRVAQHLLAPPGGTSIVAEAAGELVGMSVLAPLTDPAGTAEVGLLVEDAWQRRGVGSRMLLECTRIAAGGGFTQLVAHAQPDNPALVPTFGRAGLVARMHREDGLLLVTTRLGSGRVTVAG